MWKLVLLDQFHDVIPGTSIGLVYNDTKEHYKYCLENSHKLIDDSASEIYKIFVDAQSQANFKREVPNLFQLNQEEEKNDSELSYFCINNQNFDRTDYVNVQGLQGLVTVPQNGYCILSSKDLQIVNETLPEITCKENDDYFEIENQFYTVSINKNGRITSYLDKMISKLRSIEIIDQTEGTQFANSIRIHDDIPDFWDAWDIFDWSRYTYKDVLAEASETSIVLNDQNALGIKFNYKFKEAASLEY